MGETLLAALLFGYIGMAGFSSAAAQEAAPSDAPAAQEALIPVAAEAPAAPAPAQPVTVAAAMPSSGYFPVLPPSRPCVAADVRGVWRLKQVYENPPGAETSAFTGYPYQYLWLTRDQLYKLYRNPYQPTSKTVLVDRLKAQPTEHLQQYVLHESGTLFFYHDGVPVDTQVCFIVANRTEAFTVGQMLLMPPEGQSTVRIVKVYDKVQFPRKKRRARRGGR